MRAVNLLPRETSSRSLGWNSELAAAVAFTVIIVAAIFGGFVLERSHAGAARRQLAGAQAALDRAKSQPKVTQAQLQIPGVLSQAQPWHLALDSALSTRVSWDVLLSQLEYVVPAKVVLTSVTFGAAAGTTTDTAATGTASATVSLGGTAYSLHDIAVFLSTLTRVPKLTQVALVNTATDTGSKTTTFEISAQVTLPTVAVAPPSPTGTPTTSGGQA
jgi:Tfp pilus assembly protein PilN